MFFSRCQHPTTCQTYKSTQNKVNNLDSLSLSEKNLINFKKQKKTVCHSRFDTKLFFYRVQTTKSILLEKFSKSYRASSILISITKSSPCCLFNGKFQIFLLFKILCTCQHIATILHNIGVCCSILNNK